jgi:hypothetical protein
MADHTKHDRPQDAHGDAHDDHGHSHAPLSNPQVSHERRDINVFQISAFGIGLALGFIIVVFAMWAMFDYLFSYANKQDASNPNVSMMNERAKPPEPHLQPEPGEPGPKEQLSNMRGDEDAILSSYGWVDASKGIVRIPIDQAIDMALRKGLPSSPTPAGMADGGFRMIPEGSSSGRTLEKISQ